MTAERYRGGRHPTHGATSPRIVAERMPEMAAAIRAQLTASGAWLTPADDLLVEQAARSAAICAQAWAYLEQHGAIDARGRPRGVMRIYLASQNSLMRQLSALGMSPLARAELGANVAGTGLDLARQMRMAKGVKNGHQGPGDAGRAVEP